MQISKRYHNQIDHHFSKEIKIKIITSTRLDDLAWKFKTNILSIRCYWVVKLSLKPFNSKSKPLPSDSWLWSLVSAPDPPHLCSTNMAGVCMLFPAPKLLKARRSCAVVSFSEASQIPDRVRCHNHWLNLRCLKKQMMLGWYHCGWVEDLESEWGDNRAPALLTK